MGIRPSVENIIRLLNEKPYLAIYAEIVAIGGLPLLISIICRDDWSLYGIRRNGLGKSLLIAVSLAMIDFLLDLISLLKGQTKVPSFGLTFPWNIFYAILGVFAYGPLEVFFVIWLIANTDKALDVKEEKIFTLGLLINTIIFGMSHIIIAPSGGIINALSVTIIFLILGLIYKYTKNSIGPMIGWTLVNNQVILLVLGCLS